MSELTLDALLKDKKLHQLPQPELVEINTADGIYIRQIVLPEAGSVVPQHVHQHSHTTMLAVGEVVVYKNGVYEKTCKAPTGIWIEKGVAHAFVTLSANTILYCIHNLHGEEMVKILDEHEIVV